VTKPNIEPTRSAVLFPRGGHEAGSTRLVLAPEPHPTTNELMILV
jgi:hypothetical protein